MGQNIWPAKELEEETWPIKTDVAMYHQESLWQSLVEMAMSLTSPLNE